MTSVVPEMTVTESEASGGGRERVEGLEAKMEDKEMDILKDLPSYNSSNFSRLISPGSTVTSTAAVKNNLRHAKTYVRLKRRSDPELPFQVIVSDSKSFILRELESLVAHKHAARRKALKRSSCWSENDGSSSSSCKFPRTDMTDGDVSLDDEDSADSWSCDS